jgi:imidazole glycerol-phosphate synthase subunit HisH
MIAIIDYGMGNVRSLINAVNYVGYDASITADPEIIGAAEKIILPGVGAFGDAINAIRNLALDKILYSQVIESKKPFLGICLGLQLLAKTSEEHGLHEGLGWLDANVAKFNKDDYNVKVPHIGWNDIHLAQSHPLFNGLRAKETAFYFVHSYHIQCRETSDVLATCQYGMEFTAAVCHDNIVAVQFHPEKSQDNGIQVLQNFLNWKR